MSYGRQASGILGWWRGRRLAERERRARAEASWRLYHGLVRHAREPSFYRDLGVPDTPEARFEMVALHVAIAMRRLRRIEGRGPAAARDLMEVMVTDMDRSVRELGVGDLSVGKHVRRMAQSLLARLQTLEVALPQAAPGLLIPMLEQNVYGDPAVPDELAAALARRLLDFAACLDQEHDEPILRGTVDDTTATGPA